MKKAFVGLLALVLFVFAGQAQVRESVGAYLAAQLAIWQGEETAQPEKEPVFAQPVLFSPESETEVTLYYRFGQTNLLGAERVQLETPKAESIAVAIVERLVDGPDAAHARLSGVFPRGTRVLSVTEEGSTVYVTLSEGFLGRPEGAPSDWEDLAIWQEEATLRRWLAAQSIVCSLTEGGRYQCVQLYLAADENDTPRRIPLVWFDLNVTNPTVVLAASSREETAIMTPARAMQMILDGWQKRDWESVYMLICTAEGEKMPTLSAFQAQMQEADVSLLTAEITPGTVDISGRTATIVLDGAIRFADGGDARLIREAVPLVRAADNWAMRLDTLLSLMRRE